MKAVAREPDAMNTSLQQRKNTNHVSAGLSFKCICWLRPEDTINSLSTRKSSYNEPRRRESVTNTEEQTSHNISVLHPVDPKEKQRGETFDL